MKTIVIGLGNPILQDDGVGVMVARAVAAEPAVTRDTNVTEASVGGLRLMEMLAGYERAILVDAIVQADAAPGSIRRLSAAELKEISPTQHSASAHDTNLVTALATGRSLGLSMPEEIIIYTVAIGSVEEFGELLSPAVARAIPETVTAVLSELAGRQPALLTEEADA